MPIAELIAPKLLHWFDRHGRHDLPWQHPRTGYRVWVAEVMLQQTQVVTVIDYFDKFMARFPDVHTLAAATNDEVMQYWAGLGYYARARNLHKAAKQIVAEHAGKLPQTVAELQALAGIGRSTAGAIRAQAFNLWAPILDGNAKRVLARLAGITERPGTVAYEKALWPLAEQHTPKQRVGDYTQAIMDLGATVCKRRNPSCEQCPLKEICHAYLHGQQHAIPRPRKRPSQPEKPVTVLVLKSSQGFLLEKRPATGIWGGLWSLPELPADAALAEFCEQHLGTKMLSRHTLPTIKHLLTHFKMLITPVVIEVQTPGRVEEANKAWFAAHNLPAMPRPIQKILAAQISAKP